MNSHDIIKALLRTEKSVAQEPANKYLFLVQKSASKTSIKRAVEEVYKVKVQDVNTYISAGKAKRVRTQVGKTPDLKKAMVTLKEGSKIDTGV